MSSYATTFDVVGDGKNSNDNNNDNENGNDIGNANDNDDANNMVTINTININNSSNHNMTLSSTAHDSSDIDIDIDMHHDDNENENDTARETICCHRIVLPHWLTRIRRSPTTVLNIVSGALFVDLLAYSVVIPILPEYSQTHFGASSSIIGILFATYSIGLLIFTPVSLRTIYQLLLLLYAIIITTTVDVDRSDASHVMHTNWNMVQYTVCLP
jgi:hypothetical protein